MNRLLMLSFAIGIVLTSAYSFAAFVGSASISALAVDTLNNTGSVTPINLTVTTGTGNLTVTGPAEVQSSTLQSAQTAVQYAATYLGLNYSHYNYTYFINSPGGNVSGPSAGAAMTLLAISALSHRQLNSGMLITGTIAPDGTVGPIGGVYDKVNAAVNSGAKFVLLPAVPQGSQENMLYALVGAKAGIPLIEVANISQAYPYAFGKNPSLAPTVTYNALVDYHTSHLPQATTACSNQCDMGVFSSLLNQTFSLGGNEITALSSDPRYAAIASQFGSVLNQSRQVGGRGYLYAAANIAFLNYINTFYFAHHDIGISSGMAAATTTQTDCSSLMAPALTSSNYEYVLNGQLRQYWANYTITAAIGGFNTSDLETDQVLSIVDQVGQASGWCNAASVLYGLTSNSTGSPLTYSQSLRSVALNRINRAGAYGPGIYLNTAKTAYAQGNYGVAILDSDFGYSFGLASSSGNLTTQQLLNLSTSTRENATFGAWATQYNIESQFYAYESGMSANATQAHGYASEAYSTAILASQMGNDTRLIGASLVLNSTAAATQEQSRQIAQIASNINTLQQIVCAIAIGVVVLIVLNLILIWIVLTRTQGQGKSRKTRK